MADEVKNETTEPAVEQEKKPVSAPSEGAAEQQAADSKAEKSVADSQAEKSTETAPKVKLRKGAKVVPVGIVHILSTFNNTKVSITDMKGNVISWSSAGRGGFKGSRKSTAYAATMLAQDAAKQAASQGMREVEVRVQGPGAGRESAIRAVQSAGLTITSIKDVTPIPHNGCRPSKKRRV